MKLDHLRDFFPVERHAEVEALFHRYSAAVHADEDVEGFVSQLHAQGLLSTETMQDVLTLHDVTLSSVPRQEALPSSRHRLLALLGRGAMGEVFIARDPQLERTVAVKRIDATLRTRPAAMQRFYAEAQTTAQLDHPGIVPIYGLESDAEGRLSYAMKLVRGQTLSALIEETRELVARGEVLDDDRKLKARVELFLPILNAMSYAHRRNVLHRDLKPDNIMVGAFGEVLVMDWGVARPIGKRERATKTLTGVVEKTRTGALVGTPAYMSPEQAAGATETLEGTSDQYALGLILYELVSLQRALSGETALEVVAMAAEGLMRPLTDAVSSEPIPRELAAIIAKATAREIDDRYASLEELADDVRRFLRDESVHADPDGPLRRVKRWIGHHRGFAMALVAALMVAAVAVVFLVQTLERADARRREVALQALTSMVGSQAMDLNLRLARYEAMLQGIVSAAETAMSRPAPEVPGLTIYQYANGKRVPDTIPDYAVRSSVYRQPVAFEQVDVSAPPGVDLGAVRPRAHQLWGLAGSLRRLMLASHSEAAQALPLPQAQALVFEQGTPLAWTYVASREGLMVVMPGSWDDGGEESAGDYDVRELAWYKMALGKRSPVWSSAGEDETPLGRVVTCVQAIYDEAGEVLGVAGMDMTFGYFIDHLLEHPTLAKVGAESIIIDAAGKVVVRSKQKDAARDASRYRPPPYEEKDVIEASRARRSGHLELSGGRAALWERLHALPWTYVVVGPEAALLGASAL